MSAARPKGDPPGPGNAADIEAALQSQLTYDGTSRTFSPLPLPVLDLDTIRLRFGEQLAPPYPDTLGLDEAGIPIDAIPSALPELLLGTRNATPRVLGELDRLLLRSPVLGRFRFEPYLHYRTSPKFAPVGPSTSGRLIVQEPDLTVRARSSLDRSDLHVFEPRLFVFEHVDRAAVAPLIQRALVLQVSFVAEMMKAFNGESSAQANLAIPAYAPAVVGWLLTCVNSTLRAWTAHLAVLRSLPGNAAIAAALPVSWATAFPERELKPSDATPLLAAVAEVAAHPDWTASLLAFIARVLAPKLAGYSWSEVLDGTGERFPVPKDQPPFAPADAALAKQHRRLRLVDDPAFRWLGCFAGCPLGKPAAVYGTYTTYEVEALHLDGSAHTALGMPTLPSEPGPQPGRAMDLTPYAAQRSGYVCFFGAERSANDPLYTAADWLLEVTQGGHAGRDEEPGFVDLLALRNGDTGAGHPLLATLKADEHDRARSIRRQADALDAAKLAPKLLTWWDGHLGFPKAGDAWQLSGGAMSIAPKHPYGSGRTHGMATTLFSFDDLFFSTPLSGFSTFDIFSAYLAAARMTKPLGVGTALPVPVLLALMETEGIKVFAPINRRTRNITSTAGTVRWEALRTAPGSMPGPRLRSDYGPGNDDVARTAWLSYPYGLDTFAKRATAAAMDARVSDTAGTSDVLDLDADESIGRYLSDRVYASWQPTPAVGPTYGVPVIWKRSPRAHWASLSLMVAYYRYLEVGLQSPDTTNEFMDPNDGWTPDLALWTPAGSSPPSLDGKSSNDPAWKDYLTYYGMLYLAYNAGPRTLRSAMRAVESGRPSGSPLTHRDFLLFKHTRTLTYMGNGARFVIGLDAFLHLDWMADAKPKDYATVTPDSGDPAGRAWGI